MDTDTQGGESPTSSAPAVQEDKHHRYPVAFALALGTKVVTFISDHSCRPNHEVAKTFYCSALEEIIAEQRQKAAKEGVSKSEKDHAESIIEACEKLQHAAQGKPGDELVHACLFNLKRKFDSLNKIVNVAERWAKFHSATKWDAARISPADFPKIQKIVGQLSPYTHSGNATGDVSETIRKADASKRKVQAEGDPAQQRFSAKKRRGDELAAQGGGF